MMMMKSCSTRSKPFCLMKAVRAVLVLAAVLQVVEGVSVRVVRFGDISSVDHPMPLPEPQISTHSLTLTDKESESIMGDTSFLQLDQELTQRKKGPTSNREFGSLQEGVQDDLE